MQSILDFIFGKPQEPTPPEPPREENPLIKRLAYFVPDPDPDPMAFCTGLLRLDEPDGNRVPVCSLCKESGRKSFQCSLRDCKFICCERCFLKQRPGTNEKMTSNWTGNYDVFHKKDEVMWRGGDAWYKNPPKQSKWEQ